MSRIMNRRRKKTGKRGRMSRRRGKRRMSRKMGRRKKIGIRGNEQREREENEQENKEKEDRKEREMSRRRGKRRMSRRMSRRRKRTGKRGRMSRRREKRRMRRLAIVVGLVVANIPKPRGRKTVLKSVHNFKPTVPYEKRFDKVTHMPVRGSSRRCAYCSTEVQQHWSKWACNTCDVELCLNDTRNCFLLYPSL
ncbi:hypothetical protein ANN_12459 [Periplaneta americana]|uniref:Uncharacterized protein n=1 Tax=Periplaneta americana TaxID=6978 RepID=A0ABQ8TIS7_PERAM|nr:hypothetical protein ANN_12459 [Periplaneta americana]